MKTSNHLREVVSVPAAFSSEANLNYEKYQSMYEHSISDPESFWAEQAESVAWFKKWRRLKDTSFHKPVRVSWFVGGELNVAYNCIDHHLHKNGNKVALIWEPDNPQKESIRVTYLELYDKVNVFANTLKKMGVEKGDRVVIYMPMILESAYAMLACARIGAIHSVIFAGFSPDAISDRINDCEARFVITADGGYRGGKDVPLKDNMDVALQKTPGVERVLVVQNSQIAVSMQSDRDLWYHEFSRDVDTYCPPERMNSEDPLFILYTSGSTNKPKGVLHSTGGYLVYASVTHRYAFDLKDDDVYWCSADIGWVTGHSYLLYGPLSNGATTLMFEGVPTYPTPSRFWEVIDKHSVTIFYTAPTAIRALMKEGDQHVFRTDRSSLRLLGSVGEPINPEAWKWYHLVVGEGRCPIVDTWWQTETGGVLIAPLPGVSGMKPGSASLPFFGIKPKILTPEGKEIDGPGEGVLVLEDSWPGQMTTIYGAHERFEETYFSTYPGYYFTGDGCRRDAEGDYWITGRVDDVINVSGHRIGTAEVESAFVAHNAVAEAAVVGVPHDIKGQAIYAYVTLKEGQEYSEKLRKELVQWVRKEIGAFAAPEVVQWAPRLPKTRSGKIMRRILRKIAEGNLDGLGDTSTLADPSVVDDLIQEKEALKKAS
ncbi:MAG: acetyl-CoA synthetase [Bdellovibrio sp. ArHS]|uniref:acetate--CoA ligase n=1 Tax=Bdellovibrio sp. ArHS TaxID=1569284 RepID=UPI000582AE2B|nr:acetate--CoA ligase [Bdellovibrio sp. ArHS]KHD87210.1 MAG: acetyl-CoA synthetase [Bdellovibrio sp. ArHS]